MIDWVKLQVGIATNAKVARAGSDGALVFMAALLQHARHGRAGRVPAHRLEPWTLKVEAVAFFGAWTEDRVAAAVATCCDAGLLHRDGDAVVLSGYDTEAMPQCVRCRRPNDDHRYSTCTNCRDSRSKDGGRDKSRHGAKKSRQGALDRTGQDNSPLPPANVREAIDCEPTGRASRGGAGASRRGIQNLQRAARAPEPETENGPASIEGPKIDMGPEPDEPPRTVVATSPERDAPRRDLADTPVQGLVTALMRTRYRAGLMTMRRRFALTREAERLAQTGLEPDHVEQLAAIAAVKSNSDPGSLLAHWLDGDPPRWREVLDELGAKDRQAAARARRSDGDAEPIAAASVLGQVLEAARGSA